MSQLVAIQNVTENTVLSEPAHNSRITQERDSKKSFINHFLLVVGLIVEYSYGMFIGSVLGWLVGLYLGTVYVKHFEPVYFSDYSGLDEIFYWSTLHYDFAYFGRIVGIPIGAILILIFKNRHQRNKSHGQRRE